VSLMTALPTPPEKGSTTHSSVATLHAALALFVAMVRSAPLRVTPEPGDRVTVPAPRLMNFTTLPVSYATELFGGIVTVTALALSRTTALPASVRTVV